MANMTVEERVIDFVKKANRLGGSLSDYFCGMTNNVERRAKEHGNVKIIAQTECRSKEVARDLMRQLKAEGFDVDPDIMSGQDDSVNVYFFKKSILSHTLLTGSATLMFQKTWFSEDWLDGLPDSNGIYCCYSCDKQLNGKTVQNTKPLYIGLAANGLKNRITEHASKDHATWKKNQKMGQDKQLVYAIAECNSDILQTIEAALIYANQTPENTEYRNHYQGEYHTMKVYVTGPAGGLKSANVTF